MGLSLQSLSLEDESSTEPVAVATEPLTSASQLPMGWAVHERGASVIANKDNLIIGQSLRENCFSDVKCLGPLLQRSPLNCRSR